jgi:hypothetical protein
VLSPSNTAEDEDTANTVPAEVVAPVVADIVGQGKLPELSDEEREQRWLANQAWLEQCRQRDEEQHEAYRRKQAEAAAVRKHEAEMAPRAASRKALRERQQEIERQTRARELRDLRLKVSQQEWWQKSVDAAARNAVAQRQRQTLMDELEPMLGPPEPPPEPERVFMSSPTAEMNLAIPTTIGHGLVAHVPGGDRNLSGHL